MEYSDEDRSDMDFPDAAERDKQFSKLMSKTKAVNDAGISELITNPRRHDLLLLEAAIAEKLTARGFIEVRTPIIISTSALTKMTITTDHSLYKQVFFIDNKRCLRPMLAPNLYVVMRKLRNHAHGPVKIFEMDSCFRKESKSTHYLEEFTMLNLVDMGPDRNSTDCLKTYIDNVITAARLEYTMSHEKSDVYVETLDVNIGDTEVASGVVGPHILDAAHDIHESWAEIGFGLERLLMLRDGKSSTRKTGKSTTYLDGLKID